MLQVETAPCYKGTGFLFMLLELGGYSDVLLSAWHLRSVPCNNLSSSRELRQSVFQRVAKMWVKIADYHDDGRLGQWATS